MKVIYYIIKTLFYLVAMFSIIILMTDYKQDRQNKQAAKAELQKLIDDLQR